MLNVKMDSDLLAKVLSILILAIMFGCYMSGTLLGKILAWQIGIFTSWFHVLAWFRTRL